MERCRSCGLAIAGGDLGCQALFERLLGRDFSDPPYFRMHRTMVDTYCLQHPERYCASAKSLAAHLCGLASAIEGGRGFARGPESLRRWLDGTVDLVKPELPSARGEVTIGDVAEASDPLSYARAVERWARSTWDAHRALHDLARDWLARGDDAGRAPRDRSKGSARHGGETRRP